MKSTSMLSGVTMLRRSILATICSLFLGCATTASDPSFVHTKVPTDRVISLPALSGPTGAAKVVVMRDAQFQGSAMTTTLTVDGIDSAHIQNGEEFAFELIPGEHILGLRFIGNDPILGALSLGLARPKRFIESATVFERDKKYLFRIVNNAAWEWELKRSSF